MKDGVEYLKFVTAKMVAYWEHLPDNPEDRRARRRKRESWVTRWFGQLLPLGIGLWLQHRRLKANRRQANADIGAMTGGHSDYR